MTLFPLVALLITPPCGAVSQRSDQISKYRSPLQFSRLAEVLWRLHTRNSIPMARRAKSFGHLHALRRDEVRRGFLFATNWSSILYSKPFDQQSPSRHPADDLWNKHRDQNLFLRGLCDVKAWFPDRVELRDLRGSQLIWRWLMEYKWVERSARFAPASALPLPCRSRHKTAPSELQKNHNVLDHSKFFLRQVLFSLAIELASSSLQQGRGGGNPPLRATALRVLESLSRPIRSISSTMTFLGQSHDRIALSPRGESAGVFSLSRKNTFRASGALQVNPLLIAFCKKTKIFSKKTFPKTFSK